MDAITRDANLGKGKRAVVTGGAGFVGSHLCAKLLECGFSVIAIDNLASGNLRNLAPLHDRGPFRFIQHDVVTPLPITADWIFNLACCASPTHYQRDPEQTIRTCTDGALNVLHAAHACGARVFQASTSEIYGEPEMHPQRETYRGAVSPIGPRACYDEGKRCAETMFFDSHRRYATRIKVARIFNTYGPQMQVGDGRVVSNFIVQALRGQPLTIYADGSQTRSFCYIDDLIDGVMRFMAAPATLTGPLNLGNPEEVSVATLARRIIALTGSRSRIVHRPLPVDDPTRRCPDIALARTELNWRPRIALDTGLQRTIEWFDRTLQHVPHPLPETRHAIA
jgi:UDP-glucuronate decarboxylase